MSPDHLKLYESSASPNARRIRIFLAEKGDLHHACSGRPRSQRAVL